MAQIDAIVIAGGRILDPEFRATAGVDCKSLIPIHRKPMVRWVLDALKGTPCIRSVVLVGPEQLAQPGVAEIADHVLLEELAFDVDKASDITSAEDPISVQIEVSTQRTRSHPPLSSHAPPG